MQYKLVDLPLVHRYFSEIAPAVPGSHVADHRYQHYLHRPHSCRGQAEVASHEAHPLHTHRVQPRHVCGARPEMKLNEKNFF